MSKMHPDIKIRHLVATWPEDAERGAVTQFCQRHKVSRAWFYKIRAAAAAVGTIKAMEAASTKPATSPAKVDTSLAELALATRESLKSLGYDYGPLSVAAKLRRQGVQPPSRATLARIFTRAGVVVPEPRKKPRSAYQRFVYPEPNGCWQIDSTEWLLAGGAKVAIFQLIDDHSRLALASLVADTETSEAAIRVVRIAIDRHGVPQKFLSDNGAAFNPTRRGRTGALVEYLKTLGVVPITGKPYKPTTQGKNERFHRTLHTYLNRHPQAATIAELQAHVDVFDTYYNTEREHQALPPGTTPAEAWNATATAPPPEPPTPETHTAPERATKGGASGRSHRHRHALLHRHEPRKRTNPRPLRRRNHHVLRRTGNGNHQPPAPAQRNRLHRPQRPGQATVHEVLRHEPSTIS